ncbi:hypothetical protein DPMN_160758 [Dreissena polymorpha]|uniref:Uncharacterized protein n=1 Tax=Dreissena polymorpha TaxID=45954 RepID=A0A9D4ISV0_DREPO|nr:hypothetical protein DPMN_160758 [Dreissena polymorpha]
MTLYANISEVHSGEAEASIQATVSLETSTFEDNGTEQITSFKDLSNCGNTYLSTFDKKQLIPQTLYKEAMRKEVFARERPNAFVVVGSITGIPVPGLQRLVMKVYPGDQKLEGRSWTRWRLVLQAFHHIRLIIVKSQNAMEKTDIQLPLSK